MREHTQTVTCTPWNGWGGNCLQTCVAGLLDLDPEEIPWQEVCDLHETRPDGRRGRAIATPSYRGRIETYLHKHHRLQWVELYVPSEALPLLRVADPGWHFMSGPTVRSEALGGATHICIARYGQVVWDPHPSRAGLLNGARWSFLVPAPGFHPGYREPCMCPACGRERYTMVVPCRYIVRHETAGPCGSSSCDEPRCKLTITWSLPDGTAVEAPQPGDVFYVQLHEAGAAQWCWSNCDGRHLFVRCPDGHDWNVDGRANNCTLKDDREHRCWVRHGDPEHPETLHVDKAGTTCSAGAGSIQTGAYHGFLHQGQLRPA